MSNYQRVPEGNIFFWDVAAVANPRDGCGGSTPPSGVSQVGEET